MGGSRPLFQERLIAIFRHVSDEALLLRAFDVLSQAGVGAVEITLNTSDALELLSRASREYGEQLLIGAGTVMTAGQAWAAVEAGARFIVSPNLDPEVIQAARLAGAASIPGALSPTEIYAAHCHGADMIKVFPAATMGPGYFRELMGPFGDLRLVATGGVTAENAAAFLRAGACAIGVGSALANPRLIELRDWERLGKTARDFVRALAEDAP